MGNYDISNEALETIKKEGYEILNPYKPAVKKSGRNVIYIVVKHTLCGKVYETRFDR